MCRVLYSDILRWAGSSVLHRKPIPVATSTKAWFCGGSLAGIVGFESRLGYASLSLVNFVCCQEEESASGRSLVWRKVLPNLVYRSMISKPQQRGG